MNGQEKRERVIKGLECCMGEGQCCGMCDNCPYNTDKMKCDLATLHQEALELLKAQEPETSDALKPDDNVGCWYDITHNYTLGQVVSALKSRELCEDAVSRKYLLGQSYSIKFQTIDESDEEAYREKVVCVEDIEDAPSVKPIPIARVMTLAELDALGDDDIIWLECLYAVDGTNKTTIKPAIYQPDNSSPDIDGYYCMVSSWGGSGFYHKDNYVGNWRCWTSRPDEKRMVETLWESVK